MDILLNTIGDVLTVVLAIIILYLLSEHYRLTRELADRDEQIKRLRSELRAERAYTCARLREENRNS